MASGRLNIDGPIDTIIAAWPILAEKSFGHKTIFNTNTVESIYVKWEINIGNKTTISNKSSLKKTKIIKEHLSRLEWN